LFDLTSFQLQNPWRGGGRIVPAKSFPRQLLNEVIAWLDDPDIIVIVGSRQVGKTTLIYQIIEYLFSRNTLPEDIFYFNLDDLNLWEFFKAPAEFLSFIELNQKGRAYIFIDEVQRLENPGIFLKYIQDLRRNLKLVVSGSSSLEIQSKISESLTGRKQLFQLHPFSFGEFIAAKSMDFPTTAEKLVIDDRTSLLAALAKLQGIYQSTLEKWLAEYLTYGGYPRVALEANPRRKIAHLKEIFTSYLQKDVKDFFNIENIAGYNNLLKVLAQQIGNLVNISELANTLGLHKSTVEKYLYLLEGTFMFKRLTPFFQNVRRELSKMPKIYALDLGMRNFAAGNFNEVALRSDRGEMAENFVFTELYRHIEEPSELHFWRTQTKAEVDFIVELPNGPIPAEVKFTPMKSPEISRSFTSFLSSYQPRFGFIYTKDFLGQTQAENTHILFLPLWSLLFFKSEHLLHE
jgi:hypothetical protein